MDLMSGQFDPFLTVRTVAFVIWSCYMKKSFQPSFKQSSLVAAALKRKIDEIVSHRVSGGADV